MRASKSSSQSRIFCFHSGDTFRRTGTMWAPLRRLARMLRQTQGAFASVATRSYLAERASQTNGPATILNGRADVAGVLVLPPKLAVCTIADAAPYRGLEP